MSKIIAIDYGLKRIGLAQTDEMKLIASPLDTISSKDIFKYLHSYFQNENVESIVIGEPKTLDNKPAIITKKILVFKDKLKKMCDKPIYFIDERFTSRIALPILPGAIATFGTITFVGVKASTQWLIAITNKYKQINPNCFITVVVGGLSASPYCFSTA